MIKEEDVFEAANQLSAAGVDTIIENVHEILGTGSFTTISKHLKKWRASEDGVTAKINALPAAPPLPNTLTNDSQLLVKKIWRAANDEAQANLKAELDKADKLKEKYEKETKNSVRYKEVPDEGTAPIVGSLYVQKWFAGDSKTIEVTIDKKD